MILCFLFLSTVLRDLILSREVMRYGRGYLYLVFVIDEMCAAFMNLPIHDHWKIGAGLAAYAFTVVVAVGELDKSSRGGGTKREEEKNRGKRGWGAAG
ncbi:hypothetical protein RHGRI_033151 [Rhododendron griersonianum]|uniref:Uncharacterized protein n=1 Tax=Rhododendron griersonianum TaxID=479676 RepID=A0AAV6HYS2_9ERIC|nr:hypothetical protein RHGRI_033151 [Rhododendron griersonianum]